MNETPLRILIFTLFLAGCGGTNVGNALVQAGSADTVAPDPVAMLGAAWAKLVSPFSVMLRPASIDVTVIRAHVKGVALLPAADCSAVGEISRDDWYSKAVDVDLDLMDNTLSEKIYVFASEGSQICGLRVLLGPGGTSGESLRLEGTLGDARAVTVMSTQYHALTLKSAQPLGLTGTNGSGFEFVLHRNSLFTSEGENAAGDPVVITPETQPVLFTAVLKRLRANLRGYRPRIDVSSSRGTPIQAGDEDLDTLYEGEQ